MRIKKLKRSNIFLYLILGLGGLILLYKILFIGYLLILGLIPLEWRVERSFNSLDIPESFELIAKSREEVEREWYDGHKFLYETRTYSVPMNMLETKNILLEIINRELDKDAIKREGKEGRQYIQNRWDKEFENFKNYCTPVKVELKSYETRLYIVFKKNQSLGSNLYESLGSNSSKCDTSNSTTLVELKVVAGYGLSLGDNLSH